MTVPDILRSMADTFEERNKVYGDNYKMVGPIMTILFPHGVQLRTADDFNKWHLLELTIVKLTRFAASGMTHVDSIHDAAIYCAMVEAQLVQYVARSPRREYYPAIMEKE